MTGKVTIVYDLGVRCKVVRFVAFDFSSNSRRPTLVVGDKASGVCVCEAHHASPFSVQFKTKSVVALLSYMLSWSAQGNVTYV
jgi:hypothetical protein